MNAKTLATLAMMTGLAAAGSAGAVDIGNPTPGSQAEDLLEGDHVWTANNTYNLVDQIFVMPGASLTIEAGTVVASVPTANGSGSLAVTRGGRIYVLGTECNPVIMTSTADVATWTGGDPATGTWREAANEWGNLTVMGDGLISASHFGGQPVGDNTKDPSGLNEKQMEGLVAGFPGDTKVLYGGDNDDDDSGTIGYVSIRYAGRVVGLGNELNGLSLGGIGRETDIHHVEIMNNVDDGIEVWGGTVNLKYFSIWNIGDDSFDVDEGWRGKAQFGLIVQGYSRNAPQGSGVGDNCFETDGAEDSDAQPVTTAVIYNVTTIGQPFGGDHGSAWRDNARVQYRKAIFMDLGERLVSFDNVDGDGANGYGFNGTLSWADTWTTDWDHSLDLGSTVNGCIGCSPGEFNSPEVLYQAQVDGRLAEITDSVFFNNLHASAYTESNARGVTIGGDDAPALSNYVIASSPITSLTRQVVEFCDETADCPTGTTCTGGICEISPGVPYPGQLRGSLIMQRVTEIDPRPANEALTCRFPAPDDGFFTQADYRGAFGPNENWLVGWTAADAYGMVAAPAQQCPWDCDGSGDGNSNVSDLLALLGQYDPQAPVVCEGGESCDFDCNGCVDVTDLLKLLAHYTTDPGGVGCP